jgi:dTDP-4-dehydrorhamnose reductase
MAGQNGERHAGAVGKEGNFIETMLRLAAEGREIRVVNDQVLTPTSAKELARKVRQLVETRAYEETISPRCAKYAVC